jgi:hypothetical protein
MFHGAALWYGMADNKETCLALSTVSGTKTNFYGRTFLRNATADYSGFSVTHTAILPVSDTNTWLILRLENRDTDGGEEQVISADTWFQLNKL